MYGYVWLHILRMTLTHLIRWNFNTHYRPYSLSIGLFLPETLIMNSSMFQHESEEAIVFSNQMLTNTLASMIKTPMLTSQMFSDPFCHQFLERQTPLPYFGDFFLKFFKFYLPIHKTIIYPVIIFGFISNALMLIVLTHAKMINNTTNIFLIGISIFDTTTLIICFFLAIPMLQFGDHSFNWNYWFVLLFSPYLIFR